MSLDDDATRREEQDRERAMLHRKAVLPQIGICHWCSEPIKVGVFCDEFCREDYNSNRKLKGFPPL